MTRHNCATKCAKWDSVTGNACFPHQTKHPRASGNGALGITPEDLPAWILFPSDPPFLSLFLSVFMQTSRHPKPSPISSVWAGPSNIFFIEISFVRKSIYSYIKVFPMLLSYYSMFNIKRILLKLWFFLKPQGEESLKKERLINFLKTRDIMNTAQDVSIFCELQIKLRINVFPRVKNKNWWSIFWSGNS